MKLENFKTKGEGEAFGTFAGGIKAAVGVLRGFKGDSHTAGYQLGVCDVVLLERALPGR